VRGLVIATIAISCAAGAYAATSAGRSRIEQAAEGSPARHRRRGRRDRGCRLRGRDDQRLGRGHQREVRPCASAPSSRSSSSRCGAPAAASTSRSRATTATTTGARMAPHGAEGARPEHRHRRRRRAPRATSPAGSRSTSGRRGDDRGEHAAYGRIDADSGVGDVELRTPTGRQHGDASSARSCAPRVPARRRSDVERRRREVTIRLR